MAVSYNHKTDLNNLELYYDFYNLRSYSGSIIYDLSPNKRNGTIIGSPVFENNQLNFNGIVSYINHPEISLQPPWTTIVTFKQRSDSADTNFRQTFFGHTSTSQPGWQRLYSDYIDSTVRTRWIIRIQNSAGTWTDITFYPSTNGSSYTTSTLQNNFWLDKNFCIILTVSPTNLFQLYLNGTLTNSSQRTIDLNNGFVSNKFGAYSTSTQPINSEMINAMVYSKYFTQRDVDFTMSLFRSRYSI
jgi:hypothetical protein